MSNFKQDQNLYCTKVDTLFYIPEIPYYFETSNPDYKIYITTLEDDTLRWIGSLWTEQLLKAKKELSKDDK